MSEYKNEYCIIRLDPSNSRNSYHGWRVSVRRKMKIYSRMFADSKSGSPELALVKAREYREEILKTTEPFTKKEFHAKPRTNNTSGKVGIYRTCTNATTALNESEKCFVWRAEWFNVDGSRGSRSYSVKKYGEDRARELALQARQAAIENVSGFLDPGFNSRQRAIKNANATK